MPLTNDQRAKLRGLKIGDVLRSAHVEAIAAVLGEFDTAVVELIQHKLVEQMQSKRNERILAEIEEQNRLAKQIGDEALRLQAENAALREALAEMNTTMDDLRNGLVAVYKEKEELRKVAVDYVITKSSDTRCDVCDGVMRPGEGWVTHDPDCPVVRARALLAQETDDAAE